MVHLKNVHPIWPWASGVWNQLIQARDHQNLWFFEKINVFINFEEKKSVFLPKSSFFSPWERPPLPPCLEKIKLFFSATFPQKKLNHTYSNLFILWKSKIGLMEISMKWEVTYFWSRNLKRKLDEIRNNFTIFFVKGHFIQSFELVEGRHRNPSKLGLVA